MYRLFVKLCHKAVAYNGVDVCRNNFGIFHFHRFFTAVAEEVVAHTAFFVNIEKSKKVLFAVVVSADDKSEAAENLIDCKVSTFQLFPGLFCVAFAKIELKHKVEKSEFFFLKVKIFIPKIKFAVHRAPRIYFM